MKIHQVKHSSSYLEVKKMPLCSVEHQGLQYKGKGKGNLIAL
jgi:hypothetical protein